MSAAQIRLVAHKEAVLQGTINVEAAGNASTTSSPNLVESSDGNRVVGFRN